MTISKTPITDSCEKSADRYGDRDVIPARVAREIETRLTQWVEAADASQQPQAFYDGYSEAQMRAMQAMLTNAKTDADDQAKWAKHYADRCDKLAEQLAECAGVLASVDTDHQRAASAEPTTSNDRPQ